MSGPETVSSCCGGAINTDSLICLECGEHCCCACTHCEAEWESGIHECTKETSK